MKYLALFFTFTLATLVTTAKSWRINNNAGIISDFTTFYDAVQNASVMAGDTLYIEPSVNIYATNSITMTKRLVVLGMGYFHDTTDVNYPPNPGLQYAKTKSILSFFRLGNGANGSYFAGLTFNNGISLSGAASAWNVIFERNLITGGDFNIESGTNDQLIVRKNFFNGGALRANTNGATLSNLTCENNIFYGYWGRFELTQLTGSDNVIRNNSIYGASAASNILNAYVANNIFGTGSAGTFTNSTLKNNIFAINQTLPGTATDNKVSIDMNTVYAGGTGSIDSRVMLKSGSPASAAGLTVGAVANPDCGAFGATDPYKLSGMPNIPSIYTLTVPTSIPSGSATMNITFSVRNNN
ncbi:hypothetical protein DC498_25200 [Terrimonas sp.]|uniref:hypothetical protein n=1 Tax=Terrimonas sp. TaxID=1914338 RepID=UPI000D50B717|nr:hypothetical protein [Terrimonas sp.]PVD49408.1 hypothetical protein DC498_25200 [Terrimonas sp.]